VSSTDGPELSVVLPADRLDTIRTTLQHLRAQEERGRIEVVVVTPPGSDVTPGDPAFEGFGGVSVVPVADLHPLPDARSAGVRAAGAPVVALGETHCFPEPGWARALIEAHRGPWSVVGPAVVNANPGSQLSWVNLFMSYGPWVGGGERGPRNDLPGHNSSFKRSVLLEYGDRLEDVMRSDNHMMGDLVARGHTLLFEPTARTAHVNVSRPLSFVADTFNAARLYAAVRREGWSPARRLLYIVAWPLIPAVRLGRIVGDMRRSGYARRLMPRTLPALVAGLVVSAAGELVGYLDGPANTRKMHDIELHRLRHTGRRG
jgi:hypothetical protein